VGIARHHSTKFALVEQGGASTALVNEAYLRLVDQDQTGGALARDADPSSARAVLSALQAIDSFSGENRPAPPDGIDAGTVDWPGLEITSRLGAGSFGQVFRAWDPALERAVALKLSHGAVTGTHDQTRLQQEARHLLAQLRHPNIVAAYL